MSVELRSFTFITTEDCNFNCSYCYQKARKKHIETSSIEKALDFFLPFLEEESYVNFHGGEPLLAFEQIRKAVEYIRDRNRRPKKQIYYSVVTNGSLINDDILQLLKENKFSILLSFDGLAQDISRKRGSFKKTVEITEKLLECPEIDLEVCSVFTPETVDYLSRSLEFIIGMGVANIYLSLSTLHSWSPDSLLRLKEELASTRRFFLAFYERKGTMPLIDFRKISEKGNFICSAGQDRLALTPEGKLWGCYLFPDYFKDKEGTQEYNRYCFGELDSFIENHERIYSKVLRNYFGLRMDNFSTPDASCRHCTELGECKVCPMNAALSGFSIGKIPSWTCEIKKIMRKEKELFWKELVK
jgi:sulfatase maturation enzyme AslB (radical SAM superfamily)